jgi:hypothetical protein
VGVIVFFAGKMTRLALFCDADCGDQCPLMGEERKK